MKQIAKEKIPDSYFPVKVPYTRVVIFCKTVLKTTEVLSLGHTFMQETQLPVLKNAVS